jgi:transposase
MGGHRSWSHGQPAIHPSVLARILLFAMIRRLRASRSIEYELKHSIDFMWLSSGRHIDHSPLAEFRRKNTAALRDIFRQMIKRAIDLKIANLSELCIDGTRVLANASKRKTWTAGRLAKALESFQTSDSRDDDLLGEDLLGDDVSGDDVSADRLPSAVDCRLPSTADCRLPTAVRDLRARRELLAEHIKTAQEMDENRRRLGTKGLAQIPKTDTDSRFFPTKKGQRCQLHPDGNDRIGWRPDRSRRRDDWQCGT